MQEIQQLCVCGIVLCSGRLRWQNCSRKTRAAYIMAFVVFSMQLTSWQWWIAACRMKFYLRVALSTKRSSNHKLTHSSYDKAALDAEKMIQDIK